jgi:hypothetical protein
MLLVAVCKVPITALFDPVYVFNKPIEPVLPSILVNLLFCVVSTVLLELVNVLKSVLIEPLALSSDVNLPDALDVNVLRLAVAVSIVETLVKALAVNVLTLLVAVCKVPIIVLFEPVYVFKLPVVVSNEDSLLFCVASTVLLELVNVLKSVLILELAVSRDVNLPEALDVNVFKLLVAVCNVPITVLLLPVYVFKLPVVVSSEDSLLFCVVSTVLLELVKLLKSVLILELADSNDVNLPFCVVSTVLLELVNVLKSLLIEELALSNEVNLLLALDVNVFKLLVDN